MYNKIVNPDNRKKIDIYSKLGRYILKKYLNQLGGHSGLCAMGPKNRCRKSEYNDGKCYLGPKGRCRKIVTLTESKNINLSIPDNIMILPNQIRTKEQGIYKDLKDLSELELEERNKENSEILEIVINGWNRNKEEYMKDIYDIESYIHDLLHEELNGMGSWPDEEMSDECHEKWDKEYTKLFNYILSDVN